MQNSDPSKPTQIVLKAPSTKTACKPGKKQQQKVLGKLWGSGHGRFLTKGRFAAATVRGTIWLVAERCDGSYIYAKRGSVQVVDLVTKKTFLLKAGQSYLAKPKKK